MQEAATPVRKTLGDLKTFGVRGAQSRKYFLKIVSIRRGLSDYSFHLIKR